MKQLYTFNHMRIYITNSGKISCLCARKKQDQSEQIKGDRVGASVEFK